MLIQSVEKKLIRPIALKPAVTAVTALSGGASSRGVGVSSQRPSQTAGPRPLKGIFPLEQVKCAAGSSTAPPSKWSSTEGLYQNVGQHAAAGAAAQCLLSDSGRNSLSSLPTSAGAGVAGAIGRADGLCAGGLGAQHHHHQHHHQQHQQQQQHIAGGKISASTGHIDHISGGAPPLQPPPAATMMSHHHHNGLSSGRKASAVESGMLSGGSTLDSGRGSSSSSSGGKGGRPAGTGGSEAGGSCDQSPCSDDPYDVEEEFRRRWTRQAAGEGGPAGPYGREDRAPGTSETELAELSRQAYGARLRQAGQKAQRAQHMAQLQVFQLTQEKRRLQEEVGRLQDEVARMQGNCQTLEKHCSAFQRQQNELAPRLEETKWEVCQKSGEISLLKQQLKEAQADLAGRLGELLATRAQAREARSELASRDEQTRGLQARLHAKTAELEVRANELQRRASEAALLREKLARNEAQAAELRRKLADRGPAADAAADGGARATNESDQEEEEDEDGDEGAENRRDRNRTDAGAQAGPGKPPDGKRGPAEFPAPDGDGPEAETRLQGLRREVSRMQVEVEGLREKLGEQAGVFEDERRVWLEEKDKVIRYQRQLQQSYLQTFQRNRALEDEVRRLAAELESRDMEEVDAHSEFSYKNATATTSGAAISAVAPTEI